MDGKTIKLYFSHSFRIVIGIVLTVVLLAWALRDMSPPLVWNAVKSAQVEWLALGLISLLASFSLRARRWGTLLSGCSDPGSFHFRHAAVFIGFGANCILPANAGEIVRALVLKQKGSVPFGAAVGSILTERLLDLLVVLLFLTVSLSARAATHRDVAALQLLPIGWLAFAAGILTLGFLLAAHKPEFLAQRLGQWTRTVRLRRLAPRIESALRSLFSGVNVLRSPSRTAQAVVESLAMWGLVTFAYWSWMAAFNIGSLGWSGAMFAGSVTALAIAIPSAPGYFGPLDAGLRFALETYSIPAETAIAYTLSLHSLLYVSFVIIGMFFFLRLRLPWALLLRGATPGDALGSGWAGEYKTESPALSGDTIPRVNPARPIVPGSSPQGH